MSTKPMFDDSALARIAHAYRAGATVRELCLRFQVTAPTIRRALNKTGAVKIGARKADNAKTSQRMVAMRQAGYRREDIAAKLGVTVATVSRTVTRLTDSDLTDDPAAAARRDVKACDGLLDALIAEYGPPRKYVTAPSRAIPARLFASGTVLTVSAIGAIAGGGDA